MKMRLVALLAAWVTAFVCGGCALLTSGAAKDTPREVGPATRGSTGSALASGGPTIRSAELDELTRAFADRYVGLLASACDALKKDNPDPVQRREAQELLVNGATNVYDIASNADAFTRALDLTVVTTLVSQVWIDDDRATEVFGDRAEVLVRALHHGRVEAWALAAQVLRPDQLDLLDYLLWDWRRHNPDMVRAYAVRFSNFAIGRGKSADAEVLAAGGLFGNVGQAGQAIEEARLLTERMFYQLKREPTLLRWQAEALQDVALATPEVGRTLMDMHRLTDQIEQLPKNVASERQAILAALDERKDMLDGPLVSVRRALADLNVAVTSLDQASKSLNEMLVTANALVAHFDHPERKATTQPSRPFDIREYTEAVKELAVAAEKMNDLIKSSDELLGSSEWDRRLQQVNESADERMKMASEQSQQVVHDAFWWACVTIGILFAVFILCLAAVFLVIRRLRIVSENAGRPGQENGREARPADASDAGRKAGAE